MKSIHQLIIASLCLAVLLTAVSSCDRMPESKEDEPGEKIDDNQPKIPDDAVIYDVSQAESGIIINDINLDDNVIDMIVPSDKIPKVGDIICSGITDKAPYGFLYSIVGVKEETGSKAVDVKPGEVNVVTTIIGCSIYDVFMFKGVEVNDWFNAYEYENTSSITDEQGNSVTPVKEPKGWTYVIEGALPLKWDNNKVTVTYKKKIRLEQLKFFLDATNPNVMGGIDVTIRNEDFLHVKAEIEMLEAKGDLYEKFGLSKPAWIVPFTIPTPIPIVITFMLKPTIPYELTLSADADVDVYRESSYYHIGGYYETLTSDIFPIPNRPGFFYSEPIPFEESDTDDGKKISASIDGKISIGLDFELSAGLYGGNVIGLDADGFKKDSDSKSKLQYLSVGVNAGANATAGMSLGIERDIDSDFSHPTKFTDDISLEAKLYGKIWGAGLKWNKEFNILGFDPEIDISVLSGEKEFDFMESSYEATMFVSTYKKLKFKEVSHQDFITISAERRQPLMGDSFKEVAHGFCLEKAGSDITDYFPVSDDYDNMFYSSGWSSFLNPNANKPVTLEIPIPVSELDKNVKYSIYPYSELSSFLNIPLTEKRHMFIIREGITFIVSNDGQISLCDIDNVPGEDL